MVKVKICGVTSLDDAEAAVNSGADAVGFVFFEKSPRCVNPAAASRIIRDLPPFVTAVGVFVNEPPGKIMEAVAGTGIGCVQLHGDETPEECEALSDEGIRVIKAFRIRDRRDIQGIKGYNVSAFLLDTFREGLPGGTGETFDWEIALEAKKWGSVILSGGLNEKNVAEAIRTVGPYGVDVSSGVEIKPGKKDREKVLRFIKRAKEAV